MRWLQKMAMAFFVITLSSVIFLVLISDKQTRQQVLRPTLEALGEQLFAAVRDDVEKEQLEAQYQAFVQHAEEQKIAPESVEKVAADILNLSSRDSMISSREALALLEEAQRPAAATADVISPEKHEGVDVITRSPEGLFIRKIALTDWSKEEMAARLKAMQEFQKHMDHLNRTVARSKESGQPYRFQYSDSGLKVLVDVRLMQSLHQRDSLFVDRLRDMERKQWLRWGHAGPPPLPKIEIPDITVVGDSVSMRINFHGHEGDSLKSERILLALPGEDALGIKGRDEPK